MKTLTSWSFAELELLLDTYIYGHNFASQVAPLNPGEPLISIKDPSKHLPKTCILVTIALQVLRNFNLRIACFQLRRVYATPWKKVTYVGPWSGKKPKFRCYCQGHELIEYGSAVTNLSMCLSLEELRKALDLVIAQFSPSS